MPPSIYRQFFEKLEGKPSQIDKIYKFINKTDRNLSICHLRQKFRVSPLIYQQLEFLLKLLGRS